MVPKPVPGRSKLVLAAAMTAGALLLAFALQASWGTSAAQLGGLALFAAAVFLLERFGFSIRWRGHRITTDLTEAAVFVGLATLPPPLLLLGIAPARIAINLLSRRPLLKVAFNTAQSTIAAAGAAATFLGLQAAGAPILLAAFGGTAVYGLLLELVLSSLLASFERVSVAQVYFGRFLLPNVLEVVFGGASGASFLALYAMHPLAVVAVAPFILLLFRYGELQAVSDRELSLRRRLATESEALIGALDEDLVALRIVKACRDTLDAGRVEMRVGDAVWQESYEWPDTPGSASHLSVPLTGRDGRTFGHLDVWSRPAKARFGAHEEELLRIIAGQAAHALESICVQREAAAQREALARNEKLSTLGNLVAGVAHEVNNPLTYLTGNMQLASLDLADAREELERAGVRLEVDLAATARQLEVALQGAERIGHIVKSLRTAARAHNGEPPGPVSLNAIASEVCELLEAGVPANVQVTLATAPRNPRVHGHAPDLHQVLLNLAKNAVEAVAQTGGHVRLVVSAEGAEATLAVVDDGPGIPLEVQERMFTPFFTTKGAAGTGLGLSIVRGIVTRHGGTIGLRSAPGEGTKFLVRLPLLPDADAPLGVAVSAPHSGSS